MGHDQIFKEFLREFLKDFLELFFPEVEARLDFGGLRFLDTESFTSFPEGSSRAADIVAEVRTREGARELLLVHIEVEARRKRAFAKRMFEYFTLLWMRRHQFDHVAARTIASRYNSGYTSKMKTAISIPDPLFDAAEDVADRLGMSRSQLYAEALAEYVAKHRDDQVTEALNQVYAKYSSTLDPVLVAMQFASLPKEEW